MTTVILFTDTNGFIQLRDFKDLTWRKLFPRVKHVRIMVAKPIIEELGKHKNSGRDRLRNRARLALGLIEQASSAPGRTLVLKDKPVKVTLEVPRIKRPDWAALDDLDPNSADDRLVAASVTYGQGAAIFSHDTGPRITAHDHGLNAHKPLDDWLLEPEQSDHERKIGELQRELAHIRSTKPQLAITIEGRDDSGRLTLYRPILPPLETNMVSSLTDSYLAEYPRAQLKSAIDYVTLLVGGGISDDQVSSYNDAYDRFVGSVREFFETLHSLIPSQMAPPIARVTIVNTGSVSAAHLQVAIHTLGDISIVADPADFGGSATLPEPPKRPKARSFDPLAMGAPLRSPMMHKEPPPTAIQWIKRPTFGASYGSWGCKDFRPAREYCDEIPLWVPGDLPASGELSITAGANDVADLAVSTEVIVEEREETWQSPLVFESLPEFMHPTLRTLKWSKTTRGRVKAIGGRVKRLTTPPRIIGIRQGKRTS